jgi:hypothetical protein
VPSLSSRATSHTKQIGHTCEQFHDSKKLHALADRSIYLYQPQIQKSTKLCLSLHQFLLRAFQKLQRGASGSWYFMTAGWTIIWANGKFVFHGETRARRCLKSCYYYYVMEGNCNNSSSPVLPPGSSARELAMKGSMSSD